MDSIPFQRYDGQVSSVASYRPAGIGAGQVNPIELGIPQFAWGDPAVTRLRRRLALFSSFAWLSGFA